MQFHQRRNQPTPSESSSCLTSHSAPASKFVLKLYSILKVTGTGGEADAPICWNSEGDAFFIKNVREFSKVMARHFKARSFSSFVRQLNMYSFHKIRRKVRAHVFRHPFFKRERPEDLRFVKRKMVNSSISKEVSKNAITDRQHVHVLQKRVLHLQNRFGEMFRQNRQMAEATMFLIAELKEDNIKSQATMQSLFKVLMRLIGQPKSPLSNQIDELYRKLRIELFLSLYDAPTTHQNSHCTYKFSNMVNLNQIVSILTSILEFSRNVIINDNERLHENSLYANEVQVKPELLEQSIKTTNDPRTSNWIGNDSDSTVDLPLDTVASLTVNSRAETIDPRQCIVYMTMPSLQKTPFDERFDDLVDGMDDLQRRCLNESTYNA